MANRKPLPDQFNVLEALQQAQTTPMSKQPAEQPRLAEKKATLPPSQAMASETSKAEPRGSVAPKKEVKSKMKVNLYMGDETKRRVEQAQIDLRRSVAAKQSGQINYSLIVETALAIVLDDFERNGEASKLSREVKARLGNQ